MNKEDLIILVIGLLLLAAMLYTLFFGGEESRHGVGSLHYLQAGRTPSLVVLNTDLPVLLTPPPLFPEGGSWIAA